MWADQHPAESLEAAEVFRTSGYAGGFGDTAVPIAGPGAPLVAEFSVAEFAAAVGMSTEAGKRYLGHAVELRYRLPRLWARVVAGDLPAWKARRVADVTTAHGLTAEAAALVDRHVGSGGAQDPPGALDRLVEEAIARFMPETAEETRRRAADGLHFTVDHEQVSFAGTSLIHGEVDLADALDLDQAVGVRADHLKDLGCTESLDVRRAMAVGELARRQLALDLQPGDAQAAPAGSDSGRSPCICTCTSPRSRAPASVGRVENTRSLVTVDQIRDLVRPPRRPGDREAGDRPGRPRPRRGL